MKNLFFSLCGAIIFCAAAANAQKSLDDECSIAERGSTVFLAADKISLQPKQPARLQIRLLTAAKTDENYIVTEFPEEVNLPGGESSPYQPENWKILKGGGTLENVGLNNPTTRTYFAPARAVGNGDVEISVDLVPKKPGFPKVVLLKTLHIGEKNDFYAKIEGTVTYSQMMTDESNEKENDGSFRKNNIKEILRANYKVSQTVKLLRHDGFVSNIEPLEPITTGNFTYDYIGTSRDYQAVNEETTDGKMTGSSSGTITGGAIGLDFADQGDGIRVVNIHANAKAPGISENIFRSDKTGAKTLPGCNGLLQIGDAGCVFEFSNEVGASAKKSDLPPEVLAVMEDENWKGDLKVSGGYDEGRYFVTYAGKRAPKSRQISERSEDKSRKMIYAEAVYFYVVVTLIDRVATVNK